MKPICVAIRNVVDIVAGVAMSVTSVAILLALFGVIGPAATNPAARPSPAPYAKGEVFPNVSGLPSGPVTVLWIHSSCRYCTASMPFYRRLAENVSGSAIVAMGLEPEPVLRGYLDGHGIKGVRAISVTREIVKFSASPTVAVLHGDRTVRGVWVGQLKDVAVEDEVIAIAQTGQ